MIPELKFDNKFRAKQNAAAAHGKVFLPSHMRNVVMRQQPSNEIAIAIASSIFPFWPFPFQPLIDGPKVQTDGSGISTKL